jgi:hypothetical protein
MSLESNRLEALKFAVDTVGMSEERSATIVLATAAAYLAFLEAAVPEAPAAAPKAQRGKKAASAAEPSTAATAEPTAAAPTPVAAASPSNDMFAEGTPSPKDSATAAQAAAVTPAGNATQSKKDAPAASGKAKAPTLDEVRAAMVDVQTKCGGKAAAQGLLVEFTTDKKPLYSALPEEKYGALIAACKELVAKAK